jgi:putative ABC transport system permease protein
MTLEGSTTAVPDNIVPRFSKAVGGDYFRLMRIPVRKGRTFGAEDRAGAPGVVVLNDAAAAVLFPNADPIGKRLKLGAPTSDRPWLTVVGVVESSVGSPLGRSRPTGFVYVPFAQQPGRPFTIYARTTADPMTLAALVRSEIRAVDADVAVDGITTMEASLSSWIGPVRFFARLLGGLSALALALAALGIYGVVSYVVAQRTREIGIRMALGATAPGILRLVLSYGVALTVVGVILGIAGSFALTGVLRGILYNTSATDPVVFGVVSLFLALVSVAACYVPARRAMRVEPNVALRQE